MNNTCYTLRRSIIIKKNLYKATELITCAYCGRLTPKLHHKQKYCHKTIRDCSKYARLEYKSEHEKKRQRRLREQGEGWLGQGNLSTHPNPNFEKEHKIIQNEKKRLNL